MPLWKIRGGNELKGSLAVQGSKNAVLPIMAASLLGGGVTRLSGCPHLRDVDAAMEILRHLGCAVRLTSAVTHANGKRTKGVLEIDFFDNDDLDRILKMVGVKVD